MERNYEFEREEFGPPTKVFQTKGKRELVNESLAKHKLAREQITIDQKSLDEANKDYKNALQALEVLQYVAAEIQNETHHRISTLVSKCIAIVFPNPYKFKIEFVKKANRTEANMLFTRENHHLDPMDSSGGGVIDVAAFALRLSCLSLRLPKQRHLVVMDEPFRNVSPEFRPRIKSMLELLTEELGFQFIVATNMSSIQAGNIFEVE